MFNWNLRDYFKLAQTQCQELYKKERNGFLNLHIVLNLKQLESSNLNIVDKF